MKESLESIAQEARGLPLWAQLTGLLLTGVATFAALWAIYLTYNPPIPNDIFAEAANATSTIPLGDVLSRATDFKTDYERKNFLGPYEGRYVSGQGSYDNFSGDENAYFVIIDVRVGWLGWRNPYRVACLLKDSNQSTKDVLMLLRSGQKIYFVGTFKNSSLNGYYYPIIDDCLLLKTPIAGF